MAYDLVLRKQTARQFARGEGLTPKVAGGVGILATLAMFLIPRMRRKAEIQQYRREYSHDYRGDKPYRQLAKTQELPAMPMGDLINQPIDV